MKARDVIVAIDAKVKESPRVGTIALITAAVAWIGWALCIWKG